MTEPRVLVTGATGFIGRAVVRHLLDLGRPVTALARDRAGQSAAKRVAAAVGAGAGDRCLRVVTGDLGTPRCGLTPAARRRLREEVQTVIHCAGDTVFFPEEITAFRRAHIDGPLALLSLLATGRLQRWAHLSTAFVCGRRSGTVLESEGDVGQEFHNPYERVKLEAETACRERGARLGIDVRIFRPGAVIGAAPATAGGAAAGALFRFIRLAAGLVEEARGAPVPLRIEAAPGARFNAVPVEYVADAIVALTDLDEAAGQTMHLVVAEPPTQDAMLAMITDRLGARGLVVVDGRTTSLVAPTPRERHVRALLARYRDYLGHEVHFDDTAARRLLAQCGRSPATLGRADVDRLIDRALATAADGEPGVNVGRRAGAVGTPSTPRPTPA